MSGPASSRPAPAPWRVLLAVLPAAAVLAALRIFFASYHAYEPTGPNLVPSPEAAGVAGPAAGPHAGPWTAEGGALAGREAASPGRAPRFVLRAGDGQIGVWTFPLAGWAPDTGAFLVEAWCQSEGIRSGANRTQLGRVNFFFRDAAGRPHFEKMHVACMFEGSREWDYVRGIFPVPDYGRTAQLSLAKQGVSGVFRVEALSLRVLHLNPGNRFWFPFWGAAWGLTAWAYLRRLRIGRRRGGWLVLVSGALIVAGMLIPEGWIDGVHVATDHALIALTSPPVPAPAAARPAAPAAAVRPAVPAAPPAATPAAPRRAPIQLQGGFLNHAGHLTLFALLGWSVARAYRRREAGAEPPAGWLPVLAGLTVAAFAAEQLQWLALTRSPRLVDIGFNLVGIAAGLLACALGTRLFRRVAA